MGKSYTRTFLMSLALLAGIAHATLHGATAQDDHFSSEVAAHGALATIDSFVSVIFFAPAPGWYAEQVSASGPDSARLPHDRPPWRSRAPPAAA